LKMGIWRDGVAPRKLMLLVALVVTLFGFVGCATNGQSASEAVALTDGSLDAAVVAAASSARADADSAQLVAEALDACNRAEALWQEGDLEASVSTLDLAYELLLQIPDEPDLIQQKDDLRHVISGQLMQIYRSQVTTAAVLNTPIPIEINDHVEREIKRFTGPERKFFMQSYQRAGRYRPMMIEKLREAGMPEELSWLPLVESGFKNRALSSARALGMWQFISSTGSRYSLDRNHWVDERMDPEKSTDAAIQYLADMHGMFGNWTLALAGYNCGENRVMRLIRRQEDGHLDRFWDIFGGLPRETARYVPRFLATLAIVADPEKYGMELPEPYAPFDFERVTTERHIRLVDLDKSLGLNKDTLVGLNSELRRGTTPAESYSLKLPPEAAAGFAAKLAALPVYVPPSELTFARHRVRNGETLSTIAQRYRTSVNAIMRANQLRSRNRIKAGQRLKIPQRGSPGEAIAARSSSGGATVTHTVRRGDSLWKLASHYGTTIAVLKQDNSLRGSQLAVGQKLIVKSGGTSTSGSYTVRSGDTIGRIAAAKKVSIGKLLRANGLSPTSTIYPGQVISLP
jgi:membrane-bound lytic murein transglycosylase D